MRSTFSITTIASSTRMPIASTMPNIVSTLIEKPNISSVAKVPSSATGTTMVGIRSEEHTSELQSLMRISYAVFCLKKKTKTRYTQTIYTHNHNTYEPHVTAHHSTRG